MAIRSLKTGQFSRSTLVGNPVIMPGSYESIATVSVGAGGASTITFSSIPSTYTHLQLRAITLSNSAVSSVSIQFNSDTASNYSRHNLEGTGSAVVAEASANDTIVRSAYTGGTANPSSFVMDILDYANTNKYKTIKSLSGIDQNGSGYVNLWSGNWRSTNAISRIDITIGYSASTNFNQYSHFALYGVN